jgi:hypothetical protein
MLTDGVAMRSHDRILSGTRVQSSVLLICRQDQPCMTIGRPGMTARLNIFSATDLKNSRAK